MVDLTELVVIQPSSFCNIDCRYCYVPNRDSRTLIAPDILDRILADVFASARVADGFRLLWHNGEPLSLGIPFYENVISIIARVNHRAKPFRHCIQTNGTLITQAWVDFFRANDISPSVSIDGPKFVHDSHRVTRSGKGSFDETIAGVRLLRKNEMKLVGLCVVTATSLEFGKEIIEFFLDEGFESLGLIIEEPWGGNSDTSLRQQALETSQAVLEERYKRFLQDAFNAWYPHRDKLEIREFQDMFSAFFRLRSNPNAVTQQEDAVGCKVLSFNRFGDVTTFSPQMIAGTVENPNQFVVANIRNIASLDVISDLEAHVRLQTAINDGIAQCKQKCGYFSVCGGGSPASKFYEHGTFRTTQTCECRFSKQLLSDVLIQQLRSISFVDDSNPEATKSSVHRHVSDTMSHFRRSHSRLIDGKMYIWDVERLWSLAQGLIPFDINVNDIREIDSDCWFCDVRPSTIRNVAQHAKRIHEADLTFPIILNSDGTLMDGGHRVAKAVITGQSIVQAVRFEEMPAPDLIDEDGSSVSTPASRRDSSGSQKNAL